ncbi:MAG TPA: trypsin-like peptidase domain-containing protein, partial [Candidatus Caenarcaniphilales bacterium]
MNDCEGRDDMAIAQQDDSDTPAFLKSKSGAIAEHLGRSTIQLRSRHSSSGSGVIWCSDGSMITNAHVVQGSKVTLKLCAKRVLDAVVTARNSLRDLAALKVEGANLAAILMENSQIRVGQLGLAVGNPQGLSGIRRAGIIYTNGSITSLSRQQGIQADLRLVPGNSGGPLADAQGRGVESNSMIANN